MRMQRHRLPARRAVGAVVLPAERDAGVVGCNEAGGGAGGGNGGTGNAGAGGDTVAYEFIRMPDSTGFGDYTETGQVIPVRFRGSDGAVQEGGYVHAMYLDDNSPIAGGREIWGFPKKLATPKISHESETIVCTLHYGSVLCVAATMG